MKVTIEPTTRMVYVNGIPARVWEGQSESGVKCQVLVTRIAVPDGEDQTKFAAELREERAPEQVQAFPLRMVI